MKFISFRDKYDTLCFFNINHIITCHLSDSSIYLLMSPGGDFDSYEFDKSKEPNLFLALRHFFTSQLQDVYRITHDKDTK